MLRTARLGIYIIIGCHKPVRRSSLSEGGTALFYLEGGFWLKGKREGLDPTGVHTVILIWRMRMHIVGGFYREQCCMPKWDAVFGSGGRAAAAISSLSPGSIFHTYAEDFDSTGVSSLKKMGIEMRITPRPTAIVFSYFHPLSSPYIQPPPDEIQQQPPIKVTGDNVLRFGFLEGDAIVDARRAVYDPQDWKNPTPFSANDSVARELAMVLNELELRSSTGLEDLNSAALYLIENQNVEVVVVKRGIRGALVFERGKQPVSVPAYRSSRVFKIGTGDVFSAIFAHHWAEKGLPASEAADLASRSVAIYCSTGSLPLAYDELSYQVPIKFMAPGQVLLEGTVNSLGRRYTMEEARFILRELGVEAICPILDGTLNTEATAVLILSDGLDEETIRQIQAQYVGIPIVVLLESGEHAADTLVEGEITNTDDFVSALYFAAWAASEHASL